MRMDEGMARFCLAKLLFLCWFHHLLSIHSWFIPTCSRWVPERWEAQGGRKHRTVPTMSISANGSAYKRVTGMDEIGWASKKRRRTVICANSPLFTIAASPFIHPSIGAIFLFSIRFISIVNSAQEAAAKQHDRRCGRKMGIFERRGTEQWETNETTTTTTTTSSYG